MARALFRTRRACDRRVVPAALVAAASAAALAIAATPRDAAAQFRPVYGGVTYDPATNTGYSGAFFRYPEGMPLNESGVAVGWSQRQGAGGGGERGVRWSSAAGSALVMGNLGTDLAGQTWAYAYSVNAAGRSVGQAFKILNGTDVRGFRAVRWSPTGTPTELGTLGTDADDVTWGNAFAINDFDEIAGEQDKYVNNVHMGRRPVKWDAAGNVQELKSLGYGPTAFFYSSAYDTNAAGQTVGEAPKFAANGAVRAVLWDPAGNPLELQHLGVDNQGFTETRAYHINDAGQSIGTAWKHVGGEYMGTRAVRWDDAGNALELDDIGSNAGYTRTFANAINDAGEVVGEGLYHVAGENKGPRGIKWDAAGNAVVLGDLGTDELGQTDATAASINNFGQTVGHAYWYIDNDLQDWQHAVYWKPDGTAVDLNTLIAPTSGWELVAARAISDTGWIAGWGLYDVDGAGGFEPYERHFLLKISTPNGWNNPAGGQWQTAGNWSANTPAALGHDAVFNLSAPSPYTVTLAAAAQANNLFVDTHQVLLNLAGNPLRVGGLEVARTTGQVAGLGITGGTVTASIASVGGSGGTAGGAGVINLGSGGGLSVTGALKIFDTSGTAVNLMGGTLSVGTLDTSGNPSSLNWSSGTLEITGSNLTVGAGGPLGSSVSLSAGKTLRVTDAARVLRVAAGASINFAGGALDLTDKKLIVANGDIGSWNGTAYTGLTAAIASAYNYSAWDGPGLTTSMPDAGPLIGITTLALSTADATFYAGNHFGGVGVNSGDVLVMYTYAGDVNLDGLVDASDYGIIDNYFQFPGTTGYANGDFNYDGIIDAGDYGLIDNAFQLQGPPIPTNGGAAAASHLAAVSAVPEPGVGALMAVAMLWVGGGRRHHRRRR